MRALAAVALMMLGGCTLQDERADRSCRLMTDCFVAQGEVCNMMTRRCEVPVDAGALVDDPDSPDGVDLEPAAPAHDLEVSE